MVPSAVDTLVQYFTLPFFLLLSVLGWPALLIAGSQLCCLVVVKKEMADSAESGQHQSSG